MLIQKDTAVEATQVSMTTTLVQARERRGYLPAQSSCFIHALDTGHGAVAHLPAAARTASCPP